jgi:hypothetical protein
MRSARAGAVDLGIWQNRGIGGNGADGPVRLSLRASSDRRYRFQLREPVFGPGVGGVAVTADFFKAPGPHIAVKQAVSTRLIMRSNALVTAADVGSGSVWLSLKIGNVAPVAVLKHDSSKCSDRKSFLAMRMR